MVGTATMVPIRMIDPTTPRIMCAQEMARP